MSIGFRSGLLAITLLSLQAKAGSAFGIIDKLELGPAYGSKVFISIKGDVAGQPACHSNTAYHFAFDIAEPGGEGLLSAALAAKASRQQVRVSGYAQCTRVVNVEDLRWLRLEDE